MQTACKDYDGGSAVQTELLCLCMSHGPHCVNKLWPDRTLSSCAGLLLENTLERGLARGVIVSRVQLGHNASVYVSMLS